MAKVIILMKSGREIFTTYDWDQMRAEKNANPRDAELVVEEVCVDEQGREYTRWTSVIKDQIEGYANI